MAELQGVTSDPVPRPGARWMLEPGTPGGVDDTMERVIRTSRWLIRCIVVVGVVVGATFVVGMRTKSSTVQGAVRRMNKAFWNPRSMRTAGTPGAYASVVHHVGRRSGRPYRTPVVPVRVDGGFVIALPYGGRADWVQNVLDAGRATIDHEGERYELERPEIVSTDAVEDCFGASERRSHRAFKVDQCLRLRIAGPPTS